MKALPFGVRAELRSLPPELASSVAAHLVAAGENIDEDPELAYRHAEAARRRAARLPIVREAAAEAAYAAGRYEVALSEMRALRRMTGTEEYLPVMADCERALGRHEAALQLLHEVDEVALDPAQRVEVVLVEAGVRDDMGQRPEALRLLKTAHEKASGSTPAAARARLCYAYADLLERSGDTHVARRLFAEAASLDVVHDTDAAERVDSLDGMVLQVDLDDDVAGEADTDEEHGDVAGDPRD